MKTVIDIQVSGKKTLVRVDFNVPLEAGKVEQAADFAALLAGLADLYVGETAAAVYKPGVAEQMTHPLDVRNSITKGVSNGKNSD